VVWANEREKITKRRNGNEQDYPGSVESRQKRPRAKKQNLEDTHPKQAEKKRKISMIWK